MRYIQILMRHDAYDLAANEASFYQRLADKFLDWDQKGYQLIRLQAQRGKLSTNTFEEIREGAKRRILPAI